MDGELLGLIFAAPLFFFHLGASGNNMMGGKEKNRKGGKKDRAVK